MVLLHDEPVHRITADAQPVCSECQKTALRLTHRVDRNQTLSRQPAQLDYDWQLVARSMTAVPANEPVVVHELVLIVE